MHFTKKIVMLAVLLALAASLPLPRAAAISGPTIAVNPGFTIGIPPSTFNIAITLASVTALVGFDVILNYNSTVLKAVHVAGGNLFTSTNSFTLANDTIQTTGTVHVSQVLLGTSADVVNSTLFVVTFAYTNFGSSPLTLSSVLLTGLVSGIVQPLPTPAIVNGVAVTPPPASADLIKWKARPDFHHLNITQHGTTQTLFANVANTGTTLAFIQVRFSIVSAAGSVTLEQTSVSQLAAGATTIVSVSYAVPLLPIRYFVKADLFASGDGTFFSFTGASKTFSYTVAP